MAMERIWLGWKRPCLELAIDWLRNAFADPAGGRWDMSRVVIAVPVARAGRRLLERLAEAAPPFILHPPRIITVGQLPEFLYMPQRPLVGDLQSLLLRAEALRAMREAVKPLIPQPPASDDLRGWLALARQIEAVDHDLTGEGVTIVELVKRINETPAAHDVERWRVLAEAQSRYERALDAKGVTDHHRAALRAITERRCSTAQHVVLLATADLPHLLRRMLHQASDAGTVISALIHAPEAQRGNFDPLGCLRVEAWRERRIDIDDAHCHVVDQPRDQALAVLSRVQRIAGEQPFDPDQLTVGLGDETLGPTVARSLELAGVPARLAQGELLTQSRPARMLEALARYARTPRLDAFAALLRHPDIAHYLDADADVEQATIDDWLTLYDRYLSTYLSGRSTAEWLGDVETQAQLKAVHGAVHRLLPTGFDEMRPLYRWADVIATTLRHAYRDAELNRTDPSDDRLIRAFSAIGDCLRELAEVSSGGRDAAQCNFAQAIAIVLDQLRGQRVPGEGGRSAVELLGWLELQLDDAPHLVVTGVNEGAIPRTQVGHQLLPDRLRKALGLMDDSRRLARDVYAMTAILASRPHVELISGRRSVDGDPLAPSRLLLACEPDDLPDRVLNFYDPEESSSASSALLIEPGLTSRFLIPQPLPPERPIDRLRVTAFRSYLACPYRFYLEYVLRLQPIDDRVVELDGARFGALAHDVLKCFSESQLAASTDAEAIAEFLSAALDAEAKASLGEQAPAAARLQVEMLRERLRGVARWQAQATADGWRIDPQRVELDVKAVLDVDDEPFTITGRIDRIDEHPELGYRVIDFKTSDSGRSPDQTHRKGPKGAKEWIDLQLPLYETLARAIELEGPIELGYVNLPKKLGDIGFASAPWDAEEIASAVDEAKHIIRAIRDGVFWPPSDPAAWSDGYEHICMDACLERPSVVDAVSRLIERSGAAS